METRNRANYFPVYSEVTKTIMVLWLFLVKYQSQNVCESCIIQWLQLISASPSFHRYR